MKITSILTPRLETPLPLPTFLSPVQAGFPSPAEDYMEGKLDLNELVIQKPASTFFVRVEGESMQDANIHTGDILVVDRSIQGKNGAIIVAVVNGEFTVKRLMIKGQTVWLQPENPKFPSIPITSDSCFEVWGTVTYVIHKT